MCGIIGDTYDLRKVLSMAYGGLTVFFALLSIPGFLNMTSLPYYYFVQIFIGIFNAFLLPCLIAIMGNWFPKKNRGFLVGLWATCNNFGNIAGIQLAAWFLETQEYHWPYLMVLASVLGLVVTLVVWFFLIPHPSLVGINVEEMNEKEAMLMAVSGDKEVFEEVLRTSMVGGGVVQPEVIAENIKHSKAF